MTSLPASYDRNGRRLDVASVSRRDQKREQSRLLLLTLPAMAIIAVLLIAPMTWLFVLSLIEDGNLSLANYSRVFEDGSYAASFWLTVLLSAAVTLTCAVFGYVLSYAMVNMPSWAAGLCLALVALPFWTSVLVRTYAWLILLQNRGVVNSLLIRAGIIDEPLRLMHNLTGTMIGMIHIMLPFMVFPLYAALRRIDLDVLRAAFSLGASPLYAFWRVYFPLSIPGLLAGSVLVFVLGLGFYVTPALLGGGRTLVIAMLVERDASVYLNWGPASAAAVLFVGAVLLIFRLVSRHLSLEQIFHR